MDNPIPPEPAPIATPEIRDEIAVIGEQQRETLVLLRQLIEMLLPKGDPDKPKLEDLVAALVGQQARMLMLLNQIGANVSELLDQLVPNGADTANNQRAGSGAPRP
ncbi:MAG: hypothetical protein FWD12_16510 [Alphaproteobacteria bacterium]|nr:hypothetical protein [Alphaproteobacteria bacterium]